MAHRAAGFAKTRVNVLLLLLLLLVVSVVPSSSPCPMQATGQMFELWTAAVPSATLGCVRGLSVCRVYARVHGSTARVHVITQLGSTSPVRTDDANGFFKSPLGGPTPPPLLPARSVTAKLDKVALQGVRDLACDTFVTIGRLWAPSRVSLDPSFHFDRRVGLLGDSGWYMADPRSPDAMPRRDGDSANDNNNNTADSVLIAQFTVRESFTVFGSLRVLGSMDGQVAEAMQPFACPCTHDAPQTVRVAPIDAVPVVAVVTATSHAPTSTPAMARAVATSAAATERSSISSFVGIGRCVIAVACQWLLLSVADVHLRATLFVGVWVALSVAQWWPAVSVQCIASAATVALLLVHAVTPAQPLVALLWCGAVLFVCRDVCHACLVCGVAVTCHAAARLLAPRRVSLTDTVALVVFASLSGMWWCAALAVLSLLRWLAARRAWTSESTSNDTAVISKLL